MAEKTDKKSIVRDIFRGIGIGIIAGVVSIGIIAIAFLYLQENNIQVFGSGKETIIYAGSNDTRANIMDTLNKISREEKVNVSNYITDIYVVDDTSKIPCKTKQEFIVLGCEIPQKNIFGPIRAIIYIRGDEDGYYSGKCNTFEFVKYHEIGHALYDLKFGIPDSQDASYRKSLETYANSIAKKYAGFDKKTKKGCKEYYLAQEVETANKTLNAAREKLQIAKDNLENAKSNLENIGRNVENAKANVAIIENKVSDARNKLNSIGFLDKLFNSAYYQNAVNEYNAYVDSYNDARDRYNAYVDSYNDYVGSYNDARNGYNAALNEFNFAENNYFDKIRMEAIATSDEVMIDMGYT